MFTRPRTPSRLNALIGLFIVGNVLMVAVNLLMADWTGAATSAGLAALLWWAYRL